MAPKSVTATPPVLSGRALNRATLARQLLLHRTTMAAEDAVTHLVGLQAQNPQPPYYALAARLQGFRPEELSRLMEDRTVARTVSLRSTLHTHTAADIRALGPLVQPARDREIAVFRKGLAGVDRDALAGLVRELVEERPRAPRELRAALSARWPDADPLALTVAARCLLPLVQVTPRGLWGRGGGVALTTADVWFGGAADDPGLTLDGLVLRYLGAFGPATVKDVQTWAGLTRLREVFARLRPRLAVFRDPYGHELFDLPGSPRPDPGTPAPPRLLPEFDNLLLSHADRTRLVPPAYKGRTWQGNQARRAFLVDGFLAGTWRLSQEGDRLVLTLEPFVPLARDERAALSDEAALTLDLMGEGRPYDVRLGSPDE
ncbi:AlkZ family DNA glycosylase [Streptomyces sp. MUM 203J]|uniref:winged helix DNA-binding domain-containing protein n=1 Tax=Streptomyces sp. MUM 203J TaxID=2791990 RepID=UPI001F04EACF|nr:winged helix DNA-binding domain-containing protein [Streptomyces sp. MUM 203J]MCH0542695.1 AlkZ family DNA glycosylase [Streptomyces sp. MUM 203J]